MVITVNLVLRLLWVVTVTGFVSKGTSGIALAPPAATILAFDFFTGPLPEISDPKDSTMQADSTSTLGPRNTASVIPTTGGERRINTLIDSLYGWECSGLL